MRLKISIIQEKARAATIDSRLALILLAVVARRRNCRDLIGNRAADNNEEKQYYSRNI